MSAVASMSVDEQTRHLCGLLREYGEKLIELKRREQALLAHVSGWGYNANSALLDPLAWWLDECLRTRKPLEAVISLASQTLEHLELDPIHRDELTLRLAEVEVHLHHVLRRYIHWKDTIEKDKSLKGLLEPLRMAHGLPGE